MQNVCIRCKIHLHLHLLGSGRASFDGVCFKQAAIGPRSDVRTLSGGWKVLYCERVKIALFPLFMLRARFA